MKSQAIHLQLVHMYFSDLRKWIMAVVLLFAVAYLIVIHSLSAWGKYALIPACFFVVFMLNSRYYLLWFRAMKDIRKEEIMEDDIIVNRLYLDKHFNFFNRGGVPVGDMHIMLEDTNGNCYRLCRKKWGSTADDDFAGVHISVRYLNTSRIVASMKELSINKIERSAQCGAEKFRRELCDYFAINSAHHK